MSIAAHSFRALNHARWRFFSSHSLNSCATPSGSRRLFSNETRREEEDEERPEKTRSRDHLGGDHQVVAEEVRTEDVPETAVFMSGIQPSGVPHMGNYLGFIEPWLRIQKKNVGRPLFLSVVDLHTLSLGPRPASELRPRITEMTAALLACGVDPSQTTLYRQSAIPEISQLSWILSSMQTVPKLQRLPQYKDKSKMFSRSGVPLGLLSYPLLQAADVLAFRATHVPVGDDQKQHMNLMTDVALTFNTAYGCELFPIPKRVSLGRLLRVRSLRVPALKMSKSDIYGKGRIELTESDESIRDKCRKAMSDADPSISYDPSKRLAIANMVDLLAALLECEVATIVEEAREWKTTDLKERLADELVKKVTPIRNEYGRLMKHPEEVESILMAGEEKARAVVSATMRETLRVTGFR